MEEEAIDGQMRAIGDHGLDMDGNMGGDGPSMLPSFDELLTISSISKKFSLL